MKVAIYSRFSTDQQDRTSIAGQVRNCEAIATQNGFKVVARFKDEGISGTDDRRPGYRALLTGAERREFDGIVVDEKDQNDLNYGVNSIPMSFLIDRKGVLRYISPGASDDEIESLGRMIQKLIDE